MSGWKSQVPAELVVPSSADAIERVNSNNRKRPQPLVNSPFSPMLTPEILLSPVEPGFLDGASSLARFGLDIGGTLCKVVYFEPTVPLKTWRQSTTSASADGFATGKLGKDNLAQIAEMNEEGDRTDGNGDARLADSSKKSSDKVSNGSCAGNGSDKKASSLRTKEDHTTELMTVGVKQLTLTNKFSTGRTPRSPRVQNTADDQMDRSDGVENGKEEATRRTTTAISENSPGFEASDRRKEDTRAPGVVGGGEDDENSRRQARKIWVSSHEPVHLPGRGTLYFKSFETWRMEEFLKLTKEYHLMSGGRAIGATGGGTRKFGDQFLEIAGLQLERADELKSLVRGIDFLARHAPSESFEYPTGSYQGGSIQRPWESPENSSDDSSDISSEDDFSLMPLQLDSPTTVGPQDSQNRSQKAKGPTLRGPVLARLDSGVWLGSNEPLYPYLVVNIGSGVSILRVDSPDKFERVGGTSLGGSTFLGLANALTGCQSFEEAISLAMQGDSTHVDMLVGDIYGGDYTEMGLAATTVASSFGKLVQPQRSMETQQPQHLAKAALLMVTNNIGSIAWLHARNAGVRSIMFTGSFLHNNKLAMRLLAVAMEFWSKGNVKAVFLRHEGHAGAVGALLSPLESSNPIDALLLI